MAWITGTVSKEELEELVARGWEPEEAPPQMTEGAELEDGDKICMFYVDSDVFALMSGPDWVPLAKRSLTPGGCSGICAWTATRTGRLKKPSV